MRKLHRKQGFTLVELCAALVVLSVGLIGLMRMQMSSIHGSAFGGRMSMAVALAQDQMEDLIGQNQLVQQWQSTNGTQTNPTLLGRQYQGYTVTWTFTPDSPITNVASLNVQVQWPGGANPINIFCMKMR